jgi:alcohol dehydrogenase class IV
VSSREAKFALRTVPEVIFGPGEGPKAVDLLSALGTHVLLVTGAHSLEASGGLARFEEKLASAARRVTRLKVDGEPTVAVVDAGTRLCQEAGCDAVLGVGGGSVLDVAKAIAALATNGGSALDYLEAVGRGRKIVRAPLPFVAVPTTAGSGSEATKNSPLLVPEIGAKRSLRSDLMVPRAAVIDPDLSGSAPGPVAAAAALDALTHLIESYTSTGAQPTTDALALAGVRRAVPGLRALARGASSPESNAALAVASFWGGICLANAGLGAVHGLVAPLGGKCGVAHGVGCARLLAPVVLANVSALRARAPESPALARYAEVAAALTGSSDPLAPETVPRILQELVASLPVPALKPLATAQAQAIVADSRAGSMAWNPVELTDEELTRALEQATSP